MTALERAIFTGRIRDPEPLSEVLNELQRDASTRIAWVNVVGINGKTLAGSAADQQTVFTPADLKGTAFTREEPSRLVWRDEREIRVYLFPLRLPPPGRQSLPDVPPTNTVDRPMPRATGPVLAEVGIYIDAVSAQFGGLRRASVVNVLSACALITALIVMAIRFPAYVRGRQTEVRTLRVLGLIVIIAGLTTPWFGVTRARAVLNWLATAGPLLMRVDAGVGMAIGGFLVYVFRAPTRRPT